MYLHSANESSFLSLAFSVLSVAQGKVCGDQAEGNQVRNSSAIEKEEEEWL